MRGPGRGKKARCLPCVVKALSRKESLGLVLERTSTQRDAAKEDKPGGLRKGCQKGRWRTQRAESVMFKGREEWVQGVHSVTCGARGQNPVVRGGRANGG